MLDLGISPNDCKYVPRYSPPEDAGMEEGIDGEAVGGGEASRSGPRRRIEEEVSSPEVMVPASAAVATSSRPPPRDAMGTNSESAAEQNVPGDEQVEVEQRVSNSVVCFIFFDVLFPTLTTSFDLDFVTMGWCDMPISGIFCVPFFACGTTKSR